MCPERLSLVTDYRETARAYFNSVSEMTNLVGLGLESEVAVLRRACQKAWEGAEKSRLALSRHESNHFCDRGDFLASAASSSSLGQP
jgi:hypothetical protein